MPVLITYIYMLVRNLTSGLKIELNTFIVMDKAVVCCPTSGVIHLRIGVCSSIYRFMTVPYPVLKSNMQIYKMNVIILSISFNDLNYLDVLQHHKI